MTGKKKILLIEDSNVQAALKLMLLEKAGLEVIWSQNGWDGLHQAKRLLPDAIILDVEMPEIDGFEVCRLLKSDPLTATIPVIMHTVRDFAPDMLLSFDMGATDFVPKDGFAGPVLLATLHELGVLDDASFAQSSIDDEGQE